MMHFITVIALVATICTLAAADSSSISLSVTQDFAVTNYGYGEAKITRPDTLSFYNNGFQSSIVYFGIDLSPLAVVDQSTIISATLTFSNYTVLRDASATVAITLLNYGQLFDETAVTMNTQPTSQGSLGTITFDSKSKSSTIDISGKFAAALSSGGLFGFRVDPPGGPVTVASHRVNPNSVQVKVVIGASTTAPSTTEGPSTTRGPAAMPPSDSTTSGPATTTTSTSAPSTSTHAPSTTTTTHAATSTSGPAPTTTTTTTAAQQTTTTTAVTTTSNPTSTTLSPESTSTLPSTSSFSPSTTNSPDPSQVPPTEQARSTANNVQLALLCLVPTLIFAL